MYVFGQTTSITLKNTRGIPKNIAFFMKTSCIQLILEVYVVFPHNDVLEKTVYFGNKYRENRDKVVSLLFLM